MVITSTSTKDTQQLAAAIADRFKTKGGIIALIGDLGAGKTTFTQGFAQALDISDKIASPTFTLMRQHQLPNSDRTLYHLDLYRLEEINPTELGLSELFQQKDDIILIEWAEKLGDKLPKEALIIKLIHGNADNRMIEISE